MTDVLDNAHSSGHLDGVPQERSIQPALNGEHTKADFQGLSGSAQNNGYSAEGQPLTHYHSFFADLFTWKYPRATGFFLASTISLIVAFRFVNVLRYLFKAAYITFAAAALLEGAAKPFGVKGFISSMRPRRYYTIPKDSMERLLEQVHDLSNFFVLELQRIVFVENIFTTIVAFFTSFFGYFLIKYIPLWTLLLFSTTIAFTAPLVYLQNQELIDEQLRRANEYANARLTDTRKLTEQYAGVAAARARATAVDLSQKVQGYTSGARRNSAPLKPNGNVPLNANFPPVPTSEPTNGHTSEKPVEEPLLS